MNNVRRTVSYVSQNGQMLLITILVLTVATTIALSLIGRATLDFSMSNQSEESTRAFDAAEAGVENALKTGQNSGGTIAAGTSYETKVQPIITAGSGAYQMTHKTTQGTTETLWLVNHTAGLLDETPVYTASTINVCWSQEAIPPALIIGVLYKKGSDSSYNMARVALDANAVLRNNKFDSAIIAPNGCGLGNYYEKQIDFSALGILPADTLIAMRIRPEYADTTIAIDGSANVAGLPNQGDIITSTGTTGTGVTRKVIVYKQYRSAATIFDSVIYSESSFGH